MFASNQHEPGVVIVGAGPTGLAAGNLLGMAGIPTLILESNSAVSDFAKAIALDDEGLRICQAMGLGGAMHDCILPDLAVECVSRGRTLAKVVPVSGRNGYPLINTFYQPEFEAALLDGLRRFSCVQVRFQHTVEALEQSADGVIVSIRTPAGTLEQLQCAYLLACDGGRSTVRHSLNIPLQGRTFAQKWLVIDAISSATPSPAVRIFCDSPREVPSAPQHDSAVQRPAVAIAAPHNRVRWEFMLLPGETEQDILQPATISALLQQYDLIQAETHIVRQAVYTFHGARARTFSQGRVFLLGDAAHMMPPFGGQGLNSGLRDAHNLAWKVAMVLQGRAAAQLLATYHMERSRHAARMVAFASLLGVLFMSTARPLVYCRNLLIRLLSALPITRAYLAELRIKPRAKYWGAFFPRGSRLALIPQPEVITQQGRRVLLDEVLGTGFALLRRHANPEEAFANVNTDFWERLGTRFVCILADGTGCTPHFHRGMRSKGKDTHKGPIHHSSTPVPTDYKKDAEGYSSRPFPIVVVRSTDEDFLSKSQDRFVVVRPDRFIMGTFKEEEADAFVSALQRSLFCER